jgi:hypothetical protein
VHRRNAVVDMGERGLAVILPRDGLPFDSDNLMEYKGFRDDFDTSIMEYEEYHFMDCDGFYLLQDGFGTSTFHYKDVHTNLVALGTHIMVKAHALADKLGVRVPSGCDCVEGWLRYSDDPKVNTDLIFVCFRRLVAGRIIRYVELVGLKPADCFLPEHRPPDFRVAQHVLN